jgi:hypothetical protein
MPARPYVPKKAAAAVTRMRALGRLPKGRQNKTETAYEDRVLKPQLMSGEVLCYRFDPVKLRLADKTFYEPDFLVLRRNGEMEVHEVKGFWMEDARVKIKVAAAQYPFQFIAIQRVKGQWIEERF